MSHSNKEKKRKAWKFARSINQLDGEYKPSDILSELIEKEINGEITADEIVKLLVKKYTQERG
jgi:hypothetical protein